MKKGMKSLVFLLFCLMMLPIGLLAQNKVNVDFSESTPIQVKNISVYFKPDKMEWMERHTQELQYVEGPFYLEIVENVLNSVLPIRGTTSVIPHTISEHPTRSYREKLDYKLSKGENGEYILSVFPAKYHKFKIQYYFSLNIGKDGYGTATLIRKDSNGSNPVVRYYGDFSCHIEAITLDEINEI